MPRPPAGRECCREGEHDERKKRVQATNPAVLAGERNLCRTDHGEQRGEDEIAAWQPRDEGDDEDQHLEPVGGEAHGLVRVERTLPGAEDVGADQIDLDKDGEHDHQRQREV